MDNKIDYIIARVLSGEASAEDVSILGYWLNAKEENRNTFRRIKCYWDMNLKISSSVDVNDSLDGLQHEIDAVIAGRRRGLFFRTTAFGIAAIALLANAAMFLELGERQKQQTKDYARLADKLRSDFTLDDSAAVTLDGNSLQTYSSQENGTDEYETRLEEAD